MLRNISKILAGVLILFLSSNHLATAKNEEVSILQKIEILSKKSSEQENMIASLNTRIIELEMKCQKSNQQDEIEERLEHLEELSKIQVLRTCEELHQHGINISGMYFIDPDGEQMGDAPISVFCDFEKQVTEVIHDADNETIKIAHCKEEHCFKKDIYYSSMDQILSLMQLSSNCSQEIEFTCFLSPLLQNGVEIGSWTDRNGEDQIYFDGANYGQHQCGCYSSQDGCLGQEVFSTTCNCDYVGNPEWMEDSGLITNMTALPISAFNYGLMNFDPQEATVKIGRLRCSGQVEMKPSPSTCNDLKMMGETRSGLYPLEDENDGYPKLSHCDMNIPGYEGNMEIEKKCPMFYPC